MAERPLCEDICPLPNGCAPYYDLRYREGPSRERNVTKDEKIIGKTKVMVSLTLGTRVEVEEIVLNGIKILPGSVACEHMQSVYQDLLQRNKQGKGGTSSESQRRGSICKFQKGITWVISKSLP
jgi:hypothetical protein